MDVTATAPAEEEERAPFRISFFVVYPKSRALVLLYRQFPRSLALALALALSLSFSLFALSFKRGGYQSLLSTQETLSVYDRRCEEEVLFSYAKEGAVPSPPTKKYHMPNMPNAKCQITDQSKKKQKKRNRKTQTQKTKQNKNKNSQSREERGMKPTSDRSERSVSP